MYAIFGLEKDHSPLTPNQFLKFLHPEDRHGFEPLRYDFIQQNPKNSRFRIIDATGQIKHVQVITKAIFQKQRVVELRGTFQDISENIGKQQLLEQTNRKLEDAEFLGKVGHWEFDLTNNKLYWSKQVYRLLDFELNTNPSYDHFLQLIHPEDRELVDQAYQDHLEKNVHYDIVHRLIANDGELKYLREKCVTSRDDAGNPIRSLGVVVDITDLKITEIRLEKSDQRFKKAFSLAKMAYWVWNPDNNELEWSEEFYRFTGLSLDVKPTFEHFIYLVPEEDRAGIYEAMELPSKGFEYADVEFRVVEDNEVRHLYAQLVPTRDIYSNDQIIFGVVQDVTARKEAETKIERYQNRLESMVLERTDQLRKKNDELKDFTQIVAHDLRAPLRGINSLIQWIERDMKGIGEPVNQYLEMLHEQVQRMDLFVNGLLEYSKVGIGSQNKEVVQMDRLFQELCGGLLHSEGKVWKYEVIGKIPTIHSYQLWMHQLFSNLIANAVKHNDKAQGVVRLYAEENENYLSYFISDNGPGIPKEYHEKVFMIFQTLKPKAEYGSSGIGLSIVKKIVDELKGKVSILENETEGVTFKVSLPKR